MPQEAVMVRRLCIPWFLVALWPGLALAQSAALMGAFDQYHAPSEQRCYGAAEPLRKQPLPIAKVAGMVVP